MKVVKFLSSLPKSAEGYDEGDQILVINPVLPHLSGVWEAGYRGWKYNDGSDRLGWSAVQTDVDVLADLAASALYLADKAGKRVSGIRTAMPGPSPVCDEANRFVRAIADEKFPPKNPPPDFW
jgi:hypothetical protein